MPTPSSRTRILLCGAGNMGANHLRVLRTLQDVCEVVAVVDPLRDRAQRVAGDLPAFATIDEALAYGAFDAAVVATATESHHAVASRLLAERIPLLIEKPIARTVAEGEAIAALAERDRVPCMVGHVERFNPGVVAVRHLIQEGQLGDVIHISTRRVGGRPADVARAGNLLVDLAVHDIDIVYWLLGDLTLRSAVGHYRRLIDSATVLFQGGPTAVDIHVNWATPIKIRQLTVTGTQAHVEVNLITQEVMLTRRNPLLASEQRRNELFFDEYLLSFASPDRTQVGIVKQEPLRAELRAFLAALRAGEPGPSIPVTPQDGVRALRLAEQARELLDSLPRPPQTIPPCASYSEPPPEHERRV